MKQTSSTQQMMELISQPAFCVEDGKVKYPNQAARSLCLEVQTPVADLLPADLDTYNAFQGGCLYISVTLMGISRGATVTRLDCGDVFVLDDDSIGQQLNALAVAGQHLRMPLTSLVASFDAMYLDNELRQQSYPVRRAFHQLHRIVNNLTDSALLGSNATATEVIDLAAVIREVIEKSRAVLESRHCTIQFTDLVAEPIFTQANRSLAERAVYNMLSNAVKFSLPGTAIEITLEKCSKKLVLSMKNKCAPVPADVMASIFHHYQRKPNVEDGRYGVGLGLTLVRSAAQAHDGTALVDQPDPDTFRVSLTFAIRQGSPTKVMSPLTRFLDYSGGVDHALLELSDVLRAEEYQYECK